MVLVDHILEYEGGAFVEMETDGLIPKWNCTGYYNVDTDIYHMGNIISSFQVKRKNNNEVKKNMACFIVPMSLAIGIGTIRKKIPASYHINWLIALLGGGVVALAVEHIAHGEVVMYPPFLTAMSSPSDTAVMLHEMATIGVAMAVVCLAVWIAMVIYVSRIENAKSKHHHATV